MTSIGLQGDRRARVSVPLRVECVQARICVGTLVVMRCADQWLPLDQSHHYAYIPLFLYLMYIFLSVFSLELGQPIRWTARDEETYGRIEFEEKGIRYEVTMIGSALIHMEGAIYRFICLMPRLPKLPWWQPPGGGR